MTPRRRAPEQLRSHQWYGTDGLRSFSHRARTRQLGYLPKEHLGKPVVATSTPGRTSTVPLD